MGTLVFFFFFLRSFGTKEVKQLTTLLLIYFSSSFPSFFFLLLYTRKWRRTFQFLYWRFASRLSLTVSEHVWNRGNLPAHQPAAKCYRDHCCWQRGYTYPKHYRGYRGAESVCPSYHFSSCEGTALCSRLRSHQRPFVFAHSIKEKRNYGGSWQGLHPHRYSEHCWVALRKVPSFFFFSSISLLHSKFWASDDSALFPFIYVYNVEVADVIKACNSIRMKGAAGPSRATGTGKAANLSTEKQERCCSCWYLRSIAWHCSRLSFFLLCALLCSFFFFSPLR